jgi:hypothetical protein
MDYGRHKILIIISIEVLLLEDVRLVMEKNKKEKK